jgi:hypothetical protein
LPTIISRGTTPGCESPTVIKTEFDHRTHEGSAVIGWSDDAVATFGDQFTSGRMRIGHHGEATGQGLERHVAERFREAGKGEEVGTRIVSRQIVARAKSGEHDVRIKSGKGFTLRSVADEHQFRVRPFLLHRLPGLDDQRQVLFRCES